jgi:hypothetical protein
MIEYTQLEGTVLDWMAEQLSVPHLREQIAAASPEERDYTGHGFFIKLHVPHSLPPLEVASPISGPVIESRGIDYGGAALLFLVDGHIDQLELYANGDSFAEAITEFELKPWEESNQ